PADAVGNKRHRSHDQIRCDSEESAPPDRRRCPDDPPPAEGREENRASRCDEEADAKYAQPRLRRLVRPHEMERREGRVAEHRESSEAAGSRSESSCDAISRAVHGRLLWPNAYS